MMRWAAARHLQIVSSFLTALCLACLPAGRAVARPVPHGRSVVRKGRTEPASSHVSRQRTVRPSRHVAKDGPTLHEAGQVRVVRGRHGRLVRVVAHPRFSERFYASSFADNLTLGLAT